MTDIDALVAIGEGITPGKWRIVKHTGSPDDALDPRDDWTILSETGQAIVWEASGRAVAPETEANSKAIVALPTLFACLTALSDEIAVLKEREGWQPISSALEGRQCLGVFGAPLDKARWEGPVLGTIRNGELWNALGCWKGMDLVMPIEPPPARAALSATTDLGRDTENAG